MNIFKWIANMAYNPMTTESSKSFISDEDQEHLIRLLSLANIADESLGGYNQRDLSALHWADTLIRKK